MARLESLSACQGQCCPSKFSQVRDFSAVNSIDDIESGRTSDKSDDRCNIDPNRIIYDLHEVEFLKLYTQKRDYIKFGYRANPNMTVKLSMKSMFMCHCETGNIWTHFIPALYFISHLLMIF